MRDEKLLGKNLYEKLLHLKRAPGLAEEREGERERLCVCNTWLKPEKRGKRNTAIFVETAVDSGQKQVFKCQQQTQEKPAAARQKELCVCVCISVCLQVYLQLVQRDNRICVVETHLLFYMLCSQSNVMNFLVSSCLVGCIYEILSGAHGTRLNNLPQSNANVKVIQNCILSAV